MERGFTLVELAIVIVIAGILAAVALPIYQGVIERSKWAEAKTNVGTINSALHIIAAENSRLLPTSAYNHVAGSVIWGDLDLLASEYDSDLFVNGDYGIQGTVTDGTYTINVTSGGAPSAPSGGPFIVDDNGNVTSDAP